MLGLSHDCWCEGLLADAHRDGCDELAAVPGCHGTDETHLETWQCEMKLTVSA